MAGSSVPNSSATGGPLSPSSQPPLDDIALDVELQILVAALTGLARDLVLPRWQPEQPRIPDAGINWCAVGSGDIGTNDMPEQIHSPDGNGSTLLRRYDRLPVVASFYGPNSNAYARGFRDALYLSQNRERLRSIGLEFVAVDLLTKVPAFAGMQARRRTDVHCQFIQITERTYPILNVLTAQGILHVERIAPPETAGITTPFETGSDQ